MGAGLESERTVQGNPDFRKQAKTNGLIRRGILIHADFCGAPRFNGLLLFCVLTSYDSSIHALERHDRLNRHLQSYLTHKSNNLNKHPLMNTTGA